MTADLSEIKGVLANVREGLLSRRNVVAAGVGYKVTAGKKTEMLGITCSVRQKMPAAQLDSRDIVPRQISGVPTDVIQTGTIRALQAPTEKHRPAPGGVSIGHIAVTAGTLGCLVNKDGQTYILSNNHVLANSNDAAIGDPILQPGPYDGGQNPGDQIATLTDFVPIQMIGVPSECPTARRIVQLLDRLAGLFKRQVRFTAVSSRAADNLVDAAIAGPLKPEDVKDEVLQIGTISGVAEGELAMPVKKSGRTTELTTGEIQQVAVTVNVQYGEGRIARFTDQLMAGPMSQGGDSGSAVFDESNRLVGLLFAGSDQTTVINRIQSVFAELGVSR